MEYIRDYGTAVPDILHLSLVSSGKEIKWK